MFNLRVLFLVFPIPKKILQKTNVITYLSFRVLSKYMKINQLTIHGN